MATTPASRSRTSFARSSKYEAAQVVCTDVSIKVPSFLSLASLVRQADILIVGAPHRAYAEVVFPEGKHVFDVWNLYGRGALFSTAAPAPVR